MEGNTGYPACSCNTHDSFGAAWPEPHDPTCPHAPLRVLSLFAGIGGIDLGLERAGMQVVAHAEIDPYACRVLEKHWPDVPNVGDVSEIDWAELAQTLDIDVIAAGFPCQDISNAGQQAGVKEGTRSGLFFEIIRAIRALRPRYVILENVAALLGSNGGADMGTVLRELAACGLDAEWDCVPAAAVGAPHRRDRVFLVAYAGCGSVQLGRERGELRRAPREGEGEGDQRQRDGRATGGRGEAGSAALADTHHARLEGHRRLFERPRKQSAWADGEPLESGRLAPPGVQLLAHGIPERVGQLRAYGNAVVPQVAEHVGRCVIAHHERGPAALSLEIA